MPLQLQRAATGLEFWSSILKHWTAKTLIRPRECVGFSVLLLISEVEIRIPQGKIDSLYVIHMSLAYTEHPICVTVTGYQRHLSL